MICRIHFILSSSMLDSHRSTQGVNLKRDFGRIFDRKEDAVDKS